MNIPIVYEDDWLLVVDKPSGLLVIPTPKNETRTLTSILNADFKSRGASYSLHPCHRLDRETSGLIIYAKGKSIQKKTMDLFRQHKIHKKYIAFVQGKLARNTGEINYPIEGESARTLYKAVGRKANFTIAEVTPLSGRTNQIRIHFKQIGNPIVGESKYAFRKDFALRAKRLLLHATELEFVHPVTAKPVKVSVHLAPDMDNFLKKNG